MKFPLFLATCAVLLVAGLGRSASVARAAAPADELPKHEKQFHALLEAELYDEALAKAKQALAIAEKAGEDRPVITWLDHIVTALRAADKPKDAEPFLRRSLKLEEQVSGPTHDNLVIGLSMLVDLYRDQQRWPEAEKVARQALAIREKNLGLDDPKTGLCAATLAEILRQQGQLAESEKLLRRNLAICEKALGLNHLDVAAACSDLGDVLYSREEYAAAADLFRRALDIRERARVDEPALVVNTVQSLAEALYGADRYLDAESFARRALQTREKLSGADAEDTMTSLATLADAIYAQSRYREAVPLYDRLLAYREKHLGPAAAEVADILANLGNISTSLADFRRAKTCHDRALAIRVQVFGRNSAEALTSEAGLADLAHSQKRYAEAEQAYRRIVALREKLLGSGDLQVSYALNGLGAAQAALSQFDAADRSFRRSLQIQEKHRPADHNDLSYTLTSLGDVAVGKGRLAEAEALYRRALAIREKACGDAHPELNWVLVQLSFVLKLQARFVEAENLAQRALAICQQTYPGDHLDFANVWTLLGSVYADQGRWVEAEKQYQQAAALREKLLGVDNLDVSYPVLGLGYVYLAQERFDEAAKCAERARRIRAQAMGPESLDVATALQLVAEVQVERQQFTESRATAAEALAIQEKVLGAHHPDNAGPLHLLAQCDKSQNQLRDAERRLERALNLIEHARYGPASLFQLYLLRGEIAWLDQRRGEAVADLRRALEIAEQLRGQGAGGAQERAQLFGNFAAGFETMVGWQTELGDPSETLAAMERGRARSLLDDLNMTGADLDAGRSVLEREQLRRRENELKQVVLTRERLVGAAQEPGAREAASRELTTARDALYQFYRDQRANSSVYRNLLAVGAGPLRLSQLQRTLADDQSLLLVYLVGKKASYVLAIQGDAAKSYPLALDAQQAATLGVPAGPLTAERLRGVLSKDPRNSLLPQLRQPKLPAAAGEKLHALWQVLVPGTERGALVGGKFKRLLIAPDGPLGLLPFESLVTGSGDSPTYLLDVGPALHYAPSATVYYNLTARATIAEGKAGVLSVGDPRYSAGKDGPGARLPRLPHSEVEVGWIRDVFTQQQTPVETLLQAEATEAAVRKKIGGCRLVHLACHGLTDETYGNFFGALALTPGPNPAQNSADDGFLTLPEIYELNLRSCELALLSACETNYGPQQLGEGVWTLSRGFLVAGARRVVASNWLVDDEATAHLASHYCSTLAQAKPGQSPDYAAALQQSKRYLRNQKKWSAPYYWASFVLIGPR